MRAVDSPGSTRASRPGRATRLAVWLLGTAAAFVAYLLLARTRAVNSDGSSQALQAWDMLHGNPLLLAGADFSGQPTAALAAFVVLHVVGVAVAACGIAAAARRFLREESRLTQVLLAGIAANVVAYLIGTH
ncbi:MAG TPA: hypothetical protein VF482_12515, partial [Trebonia sp.]